MSVSRRGFIAAMGAALGAVALPVDMVAAAQNPLITTGPFGGWVKLVVPCTAHGFVIASDTIREMFDNFTAVAEPRRALPVDVDFRSLSRGDIVGWIKEVRLNGETLEGRLEIPEQFRSRLAEHAAIAPAFISDWRDDSGRHRGARLVAAALTNTPAVPGTELR